ncbi:MAG: hypothetical protein C4536_05290 [Actinobacteria bacterium]|jgi:hypothetical protein|nr:MAG: hypothetical protein C4536_05290 [Actinomycetota bacterium]
MEELQVDVYMLEEFERGLDPRYPERSRIPARVLGYGEISTVFEIQAEGMEGYAFKRLPIFKDREEIEPYLASYEEYNRVLREEVGISLPAYGHADFVSSSGRPVFFIVQEQLPANSIGNQAIHILPDEEIPILVRMILRELAKVWDFNHGSESLEVAIDGQISNWSIVSFDAVSPHVDEATRFLYMDTSTPLFRIEGEEQLDPELFLRSAPSFLVWLIRLFFLEDVMTRYYDFRLVAIDLIANFYKEQRAELIPRLVETANDFFSQEASHLDIEPISEKDIASYYREDRIIWALYLALRKLDRFLHARLMRREYPYILPGKIKRK